MSSIAQYLDQKRTVRPIDWANARPAAATAARPRAPAVAADPEPRQAQAFRRMILAGGNEPAGDDEYAEGAADDLFAGRRGAPAYRQREAAPAPPPPPVVDFEAQLTEAYHRGVQEGLDAARNEAATQRAMERAELQKRAVVDRLDFQMNEFGKLSETVAQGLGEIEKRVAAATARILQPFLAEAVSRNAIDDLAGKIAKLTTTGHPPLLRVRGPEALLAKLKQRIEHLAVEVEFTAVDSVEITVTAAETTIQSQLGPWAEVIQKLSETR